MKDYFFKEKCPNCKSSLLLGYRFCPKCGILVGNDGPRVKKLVKERPLKEDKKSESIISKTYSEIVTNISQSLNESDKILNENIYPILIKLDKGVEIIKFNKDLEGKNYRLGHDYKGYYFLTQNYGRLNKEALKEDKKYYLSNNDFIECEDGFFIYTILDQEDLSWNKKDVSELDGLFPFLEKNANTLILKSSNSYKISLNNEKIDTDRVVSNSDFFIVDSRKFVLKDDFLYYQDKPEDFQKKSRAIFANNIRKDDYLDVNIEKKEVSGKDFKKVLLKDIKFKIKPGELVLVLGSSGAGKSTLFKEFLNQENPSSKLSLGELDFKDNFELIKRMVSTVPQFNLNRDNDTVFMTLKNAGELKLSQDFVKDENLLDQYVEEILDMLNLTRLKDSLVKDLSGGEKKRLSIASEYIGAPVIFLLDEPDSGLDGTNARAIMNNLREIANDNKIVMVISHTPDRTKELFDKILVLGKSEKENCGKLAFFGSPDKAMEFFESENLEKILDRLEENSDYYIEKFKEIQ